MLFKRQQCQSIIIHNNDALALLIVWMMLLQVTRLKLQASLHTNGMVDYWLFCDLRILAVHTATTACMCELMSILIERQVEESFAEKSRTPRFVVLECKFVT